ncbi:peptidylprolyl isomerase [Bremerella cremea]|uniref:peptidylprolyl isomerase n=1 Tax=Blastopirellula marina TaxID=124 RepID=A0A2S8G5X8_9BACT|nr:MULTISPECIES: peptidylprolyl isomerase [Pirellulaceae]PQO39862.1 peptidylprolyl isomerase [Blastopirellula marina]RCS51328.1 peptidylprolyl isomerase [Bremerella cremea]
MTGKDATRRLPLGKSWVLAAAGFVVLIGGVVAWRQITGGPQNAEAQAPVQQRAAQQRPVQRPAAAAPAATPVEEVAAPATQKIQTVAVVNREPITRSSLADETLRRHGEEVLESLLNRHLIAMACQQQGIQITEGDIDVEINNIAKKFGLSVDRWLGLLKEERNVSPGQYRRDIIWPTLALRRLAASELEVTPEEIQVEMEKNYGPKVKVRMLSVNDRGLAEELRAKAAANPESFADLAKDYSQDINSAAARGLIPPIRKHIGNQEIEDTVFAMKAGEISPVLFVASQYLVFKCEEQLAADYDKIPAGSLEGIRNQLAEQVRESKMRDAAATIYEKLQANAQIVNVYNDPAKASQMPGVAATLNGQPVSLRELQEECINRHGVEVLDGEINRKILQQELTRRQLSVTEADLEAEIVRAADSLGFLTKEGKPDMEAWLKQVTEEQGVSVELYVRDAVWPTVALKKLVDQQVQVSEEDITKGFAANYGERAQVLAIVVDSQRRAQEVWEMARRNPTEKFFGELARQYSIEPVSKNNDGQVPPIRRHSGQPTLEEEAFKLKPGQISGIIQAGNQSIILYSLGLTKPVITNIEDVRDELVKELHEKKLRLAMADEFERLRDNAQIDNFLANTTQAGKAYEAAVRQQMQQQRK